MLYPGHLLISYHCKQHYRPRNWMGFMGKKICFYASACVGSVINTRSFVWKRKQIYPFTPKLTLYPVSVFFKIVHHLPNCSFQKPQSYSCPPYNNRPWNPLKMPTGSCESSISLSWYSLFFHHSCLFHGNSPSDLPAFDSAPVWNTPLTRVSFSSTVHLIMPLPH